MPKPPSTFIRLLRNRSGLVGLLLVTLYVVVGVTGLLGMTPYPVNDQHVRDRLTGPSATYALGTDLFGRDMFSRLMKGAANSLQVAVLSVTIATLAGTAIGTVSGFVGGLFDNVVMRIMDVFFALPALLLALVIVSVFGPGGGTTVIAIGIVYTPIFARVSRGPVLAVKEMEFIMAARCLGTQPPEPSWGVMLSEGRALAEMAPWLMIFPALAIMLGVLGFNLLGDGLRDVLDPRLRGVKT
ncbi:MAG: diguanylate cyclase [Chloroflexi bacterium]|nr:MAG: diguanylate cyclase [Chloroflexota bacterium]